MQVFRARPERALPRILSMLALGLLGPVGIHAQECSPGTFFVSSFLAEASPSVPPPGGFCVEDNGPRDLDPADDVIRFQETVSDPLAGTKQLEGTARVLLGTVANGFGVQLEGLRETTVSGPPSNVVPSISIFVQAGFSPGILSNQAGSVTTHLDIGQNSSTGFKVIASGWWGGRFGRSFGQAIDSTPADGSSPPDGVGEITGGMEPTERVTLQVASTGKVPGSVLQVREARATVNVFVASQECLDSNFFVSTFSNDLYVDVFPRGGFCAADNGPADLNPIEGVIQFDQTVRDLSGTRKQFKGTARLVLGGGLVPFGVELVDFHETVLSQPGDGGRIRPIPIYVLSRFSEGVPANRVGRVYTHIEGMTANHVVPFTVIDQGFWAGRPRVSSGHIIGIPQQPISIRPITVTSPLSSGMLGTETVTYRYLGTSAEYGAEVILDRASAIVQAAGIVDPGGGGGGGDQEQVLELGPIVAENFTTEVHAVTATLDPAEAGIQVTFTVVGGPNAGVTGTAETDAFGNATFIYENAGGPGTDTIQATAGNITSNQVTKVWVEDEKPPTCVLTGSGPDYILITVQDSDSGLASVTAPEKINATVDIPTVVKGTTDALVVTATKIDKTKRSQIELQIVDLALNDTFCDPVLLSLSRQTGKPETVTLADIPRQEHLVFIQNGTPGLTHLELEVNGRKLQLGGWKAGEEREIDVSFAMREGDNIMVLTAYGRPGGEAIVLVHD